MAGRAACRRLGNGAMFDDFRSFLNTVLGIHKIKYIRFDSYELTCFASCDVVLQKDYFDGVW